MLVINPLSDVSLVDMLSHSVFYGVFLSVQSYFSFSKTNGHTNGLLLSTFNDSSHSLDLKSNPRTKTLCFHPSTPTAFFHLHFMSVIPTSRSGGQKMSNGFLALLVLKYHVPSFRAIISTLSFLKNILFIYFQREGKGRRKRGRESSTCGCSSIPPLGTWTTAQACVLDWESNQ